MGKNGQKSLIPDKSFKNQALRMNLSLSPQSSIAGARAKVRNNEHKQQLMMTNQKDKSIKNSKQSIINASQPNKNQQVNKAMISPYKRLGQRKQSKSKQRDTVVIDEEEKVPNEHPLKACPPQGLGFYQTNYFSQNHEHHNPH